MVTSQLTIRSKKRSSLAAFSRTIASTAGDGSMFRKLICKGICMFFSFSILKPMPPRSRASLDLVDHVVHSESYQRESKRNRELVAHLNESGDLGEYRESV